MKYTLLLLVFVANFAAFAQDELNVFDVARNGTVSQANLLLKNNKNAFNVNNNEGYAPLTLACYRGNIEVVKVILENKCDVNANSNMGTPLMAAVVKGHLEIVKLLIDKKADVNLSDNNRNTPLIYATMFTNIEIVKLLLKSNADPNYKDKNGKTALDIAIQADDDTLIQIIKTKY